MKFPLIDFSLDFSEIKFLRFTLYTVNNYMQVTGMDTGENFAFFIYRHIVKILWASAVGFNGNTFKIYSTCLHNFNKVPVYEKCKVFTCSYACNLHVIIDSVN